MFSYRLYKWATLTSCGALAIISALSGYRAGLSYDDALMASIARNITAGLGYATSYTKVVPFDPVGTSGPALILPAAALISLFGNQIWVPNIAGVLINFTSLILLGSVVSAVFEDRLERWFACLLGLSSLIIYSGGPGIRTWHMLFGDIPCILQAAAGTGLIAAGLTQNTTKSVVTRSFGGGVMLACAFMTKSVAVFPVLAVFSIAIVYSLRGLIPAERVVKACTTMCLPILLAFSTSHYFEVRSFATPADLQAHNDVKQRFFKYFASGLGQLEDAPDKLTLLTQNVARNSGLLELYIGSKSGTLLICIVILSTLWWAATKVEVASAPALWAAVLLLATVMQATWWLLLSDRGWIRHLQPGLAFVSLGCLFVYLRMASLRLKVALATALCIVTVKPLQDCLHGIWYLAEESPRTKALRRTKEKVASLQTDKGQRLIGYGWWVSREIEYLLPSPLNFFDAQNISGQDVKGKKLILVRDDNVWLWDSFPDRQFAEKCDTKVLYRDYPFTISAGCKLD